MPPHVDYALTPLGRSLEPIILALDAWGKAHVLCKDGKRIIRMPHGDMMEDPRKARDVEAAKVRQAWMTTTLPPTSARA